MTTFVDNNGIEINSLLCDFSPISLLQIGSFWYEGSVGVVFVILLLSLSLIFLLWNRLKSGNSAFDRLQNTFAFAVDSCRTSIWYFDVTKNSVSLEWGKSFLPKVRMDFDEFVELLLPECRDHFRKLIDDVSLGRQGRTSAFCQMKSNKTCFYVECHFSGLREGPKGDIKQVVVAIKEITEIVESRKEHELERLKIDLVITSCGIALWDYDVLQRRIFSNRESFFRKEQPMDVDSYVESIHPDDREAVLHCIQQMDEGTLGRFDIEIRTISADYEDFQWIVITGIPYKRDESGRIVKYTGLCRNNTDWRKIREDVVELKDKKIKASQLELAFLADINYRLRTPLNAVIGFSSLLDKTEDEHDRQLFLEAIRLNNELLLATLSDIVAYSKTEEEINCSNKTLFSVARICQEAYDNARTRVPAGVEFLVNLADEDIIVEADRKKIVTVLDNLLDNAVKFTTKGKIEIGFEQKGDRVEFFVSDTGIGIPRDRQGFVFEKLTKLNESTAGMGLGLAICKNIVEHAGGTIGVESKEGVGSRFWVRLPFVDVVSKELENKNEANNNVVLNSNNMDHTEMTANNADLGNEKPFILIAEDNESNYFLAYTILKKDYKIEHAVNGVEAVEMVASQNPDLVLMDMKMPIMGGLEATRKIRDTGATLPIIALTAHAFDSDMDQALEAGCDDFVTKPIDTTKLKEVIKKHLEK